MFDSWSVIYPVATTSRPIDWLLAGLSAARRRRYFVGLQAFKVVANANPSYLVDRFACRLNIDLELRRSNRCPPQPFEPPPRRTEAFKHSSALEALDLLNSINFTSFTPAHLPLLKRTLRDALFSRDVAYWNARVRNERLPTRLLIRTQTPLTPPRARL